MPTQFTRAEFIALGLASVGAQFLRVVPAQAASDTLLIIQNEPPRSMDPADQVATATAAVLAPMFEGLTRYDEKFNAVPGLAASWTSDPEGTVWTFKLRPNIRFHDGTPCDADAVVASFQRHLDVKRGLAASGRFRGVIAAVQASDPETVVFTLKAPYPAFIRLLAVVAGGIVSPAADKSGQMGRKPVGTGPFKFVEWAMNDHVSQERFADYWGTKSGISALKWTWSSEPSVMNMAIRTREADVAAFFPPLFAATVKTQRDLTLIQGEGAAVYWLALNTQLKPLDDVRVRRALNYATDRAALVRSLLFGYGTPANSPLSPVTQYFDPTVQGYPYDIARAQDLLKQAGYPDGISINVAVQSAQANIAEALQGMWANAGIKLDVQRMETGVWVQAAFGNPQQKAQQKIYSVLASWSAGAIDADLQFRPLYSTSAWSPTSANLGFYSNETLDGLLDKAASTLDSDTRKALYAQAQRIVQTDAPHVLLYYPKDLTAVHSNVKGIWQVPGGQVMASTAQSG
jgi:glutathione transport system substrate-binding protein